MGTEYIPALIAVGLLFLYVILDAINAHKKYYRLNWIPFILMIIGTLILIVTISGRTELVARDWVQIVLTGGLLTITAVYARSTQKMAEEMREQRVMASRPVIIQKAVYKESDFTDEQIQWIGYQERGVISYFSHFEIYNAGNGPAIQVEIFLLNKEKVSVVDEETKPISWRASFLRASDPAIKFRPSNTAKLDESITYYLVCEYQSIFSRETWYQTWLAFKATKSGQEDEILIVAGELEFKEVSKRERFDTSGSRGKPK